MKHTIKYIAKWEGGKNGNPVLFFPEYSVNRGRIAYYVRTGEHGEACLNYYSGLRNPRTVAEHGEVLALMLFYQRNKAAPHESLVQVKRDSHKMRKQREV